MQISFPFLFTQISQKPNRGLGKIENTTSSSLILVLHLFIRQEYGYPIKLYLPFNTVFK